MSEMKYVSIFIEKMPSTSSQPFENETYIFYIDLSLIKPKNSFYLNEFGLSVSTSDLMHTYLILL
jgi:hypothetical protein